MPFSDPSFNCPLCPRLVAFRQANAASFPDFHNAPVPAFGPLDAKLLIVGLAPGLKGANATGRPFTGDYAGDLLYATLLKFRLATGTYSKHKNDGLALNGCRITNVVRCVPPENKPTTEEIKTCRPFLIDEMAAMPNLRAIIALGAVYAFKHGAIHTLPDDLPMLADSYHCSRYNTNTGRLTTEMFESVFEGLLERL